MAEKIITLDSITPLDIYGVNDAKLDLIKKFFPKLKIIARGDNLKIVGEEDELAEFESKFNIMLNHFHTYGQLTNSDIDRVMTGGVAKTSEESKDVLVFGNAGVIVKARTPNQRKMVESIDKNDMLFAIGPAGTGKTYTAVALAVRALKNKLVKRIILTRPAVEAGESLGFLPGDLKEKLDPYLQPLYDALHDMIPAEKLMSYLESNVVQIAPLAFMRGRTLDNAFVILDEAQNATEGQLKMFLTRMGNSAKFIITGDLTQIDLPRNVPSGLSQAEKVLNGIDGIDFIYLDGNDIVRHKLVKKIVERYQNNLETKK